MSGLHSSPQRRRAALNTIPAQILRRGFPEHFNPETLRWLRTDPVDATTGRQQAGELMGMTRGSTEVIGMMNQADSGP